MTRRAPVTVVVPALKCVPKPDTTSVAVRAPGTIDGVIAEIETSVPPTPEDPGRPMAPIGPCGPAGPVGPCAPRGPSTGSPQAAMLLAKKSQPSVFFMTYSL